jgi:hypothetical protein
VVLSLAASGRFTLWGAVLVDVGSALLVTLNGMRMLRYGLGLPAGSKAACVGEAAVAATMGRARAAGDGSKEAKCCAEEGCRAGRAGGEAELSSSHSHNGKGDCCGASHSCKGRGGDKAPTDVADNEIAERSACEWDGTCCSGGGSKRATEFVHCHGPEEHRDASVTTKKACCSEGAETAVTHGCCSKDAETSLQGAVSCCSKATSKTATHHGHSH